jgi:hypothetical protein
MQAVKEISVTDGNPDMLAPLFLIIFISAMKDLFEDVKRHKSDREENMKTCNVLDLATGNLIPTAWRNVRVGDIIRVHCSNF